MWSLVDKESDRMALYLDLTGNKTDKSTANAFNMLIHELAHPNDEVWRCEGCGHCQRSIMVRMNQRLVQVKYHDLSTN